MKKWNRRRRTGLGTFLTFTRGIEGHVHFSGIATSKWEAMCGFLVFVCTGAGSFYKMRTLDLDIMQEQCNKNGNGHSLVVRYWKEKRVELGAVDLITFPCRCERANE